MLVESGVSKRATTLWMSATGIRMNREVIIITLLRGVFRISLVATPEFLIQRMFEAVGHQKQERSLTTVPGKVEREGNIVRIEIEIPEDAAVGVLMDCHIEFKTANRPRTVFKGNEVFRVVEQEAPQDGS